MTYRENIEDKLEGQMKDEFGTYSFPTSHYETTTDFDSGSESEIEDECSDNRK